MAMRLLSVGVAMLLAVEVEAQQDGECNIMDMYAHLLSITSDEDCRSGRNEGHGDPPGEQPGEQWFPGATDYCNAMCGATFEPFWDQCGALLTSMDMGGMEEMGLFCELRRARALCWLGSDVRSHGACLLPASQTTRASSRCTRQGSAAPSATSTHMTAISLRWARPAVTRAAPTAMVEETCHTSAR
jgi:hypothetical protein